MDISPFKNAPGVGENIFIEGDEIMEMEIDDSSLSHSRGIVNIKSVISLNTNTYQESINENSDDHK